MCRAGGVRWAPRASCGLPHLNNLGALGTGLSPAAWCPPRVMRWGCLGPDGTTVGCKHLLRLGSTWVRTALDKLHIPGSPRPRALTPAPLHPLRNPVHLGGTPPSANWAVTPRCPLRPLPVARLPLPHLLPPALPVVPWILTPSIRVLRPAWAPPSVTFSR